jgi:quercetin dioxygenase-like cupin family protein
MGDYFSKEAATSTAMRIILKGKHPHVTLTDGITAEPLMGDRLNINIVTIAPGAVAPAHAHDEEQMGYVVSGSCDFFDDENSTRLGPGDTYHAPPGATHGARAHEDGCLIIDVFSPPRAGLKELLDKS